MTRTSWLVEMMDSFASPRRTRVEGPCRPRVHGSSNGEPPPHGPGAGLLRSLLMSGACVASARVLPETQLRKRIARAIGTAISLVRARC
jgi:hypothetical protein